MSRTVHRACTLCEAGCGLAFEVEGDRVLAVRPDDLDVLSHGYVCPKGIANAALHHDPDRLRTPLRRTAGGRFEPIEWDDALDLVGDQLTAIRKRHGADAIAVYLGNPLVHDHAAILVRSGFLKAVGTKNSTSAGSQDTSPRFAASWYLYGSSLAIPVPDVDRTDYLLCLGANPVVSNGSFLTAPDMRGRLRAIRRRGGKVIVVDPRRTETAREADEHVAIRPGGDAAFLLAMVAVLVQKGRVAREWLGRATSGWDEIEGRLAAFTPDRVAVHTGVPADTIERLAIDFADAPTSVAYSRIGLCNNAFGTLANWATDLLNAAAGRLGAVGGAMFASPPIDVVSLVRQVGGDGHARWRSRVRGLPETLGDLPASVLAEEMETPGTGQVRAFVTLAGNPVLSTPNGRRLAAALPQLEFMVSVDFYLNETTRHADVILPPASTLTGDHVDLMIGNVFARNVARWSPAALPQKPDERADWEILTALAERLGGGPTGQPLFDRAIGLARRLGLRWHPSQMMSLALRLGPHGDRFLPGSKGLNRSKLEAAPHGIDLGPLEPGVERRVFHKDRRIHVGAAPFVAEMDALARGLAVAPAAGELLLIGRREVRSNNSWMHNVEDLVSGAERCLLYVHPEDAARAGVADGHPGILESRVHQGAVRVRVTDEMRPGVVSLPHGWGHAESAPFQQIAPRRPGVSANDWTDDQLVESVVGQSILNGVPVRLRAA